MEAPILAPSNNSAPSQERALRLRQTIERFFENTLIISEYYRHRDQDLYSSQTQLWANLTTQTQQQALINYSTEVHYLNLDDPTFTDVDVVDRTAPYQFKHQGNSTIISLVLFRPKSVHTKSPIAIFSHGGQPSTIIRPDSLNPQFIAFSGFGYLIACPNYRGGSAKNHGQDLQAVLSYLSQFEDVDITKTVLAGISAGTTLNAQILDTPLALNFAGIFLHTGLYEDPTLFDVLSKLDEGGLGDTYSPAVLLVSSAKDELVSLKATVAYLKSLQDIYKNVTYLIVKNGGHNLVAPAKQNTPLLLLGDKKHRSDAEIIEIINALKNDYNSDEIMLYASHFVEFLDRLAYGEMPTKSTPMKGEKYPKPQGREIIAKAEVQQALKSRGAVPADMELAPDLQNAPYTPSEAHLKIILGNDFDGEDLDGTIFKFLKKYDDEKTSIQAEFGKAYPVIEAEWGPVIAKQAAGDRQLMDLIRQIIDKERQYKGSYVLYHGTESTIGFIYDLYSSLRRLLMLEKTENKLDRHVKRLRLMDEAFIKIISAQDLIDKMRPLSQQAPQTLFNYLPGYEDVAVSAQWYLFGAYKYWFNSTFFRYFREGFAATDHAIESFIDSLFSALGVDDKAVLSEMTKRYSDLYNKYFNKKGGRLLQIFVSPTIIDEVAYISETGGFPLELMIGGYSSTTHKPSQTIKLSTLNPLKFEAALKQSRANFKEQNGKDRQEFSLNAPALKYINSVEARLFMKPEYMDDPRKIQIISYYSHPPGQNYLQDLQKLIAQDLGAVLNNVSAFDPRMSYNKPALIQLHDYMEKGSAKNSQEKQHKPSMSELYRLLVDAKWEQAEEWSQRKRQDRPLHMDPQGQFALYYLLANAKFDAAVWLMNHHVTLDESQLLDLIAAQLDKAVDVLFSIRPELKIALIEKLSLTALIEAKQTNLCVWLIRNRPQVETVLPGTSMDLILASSKGLTAVVNALIAKMRAENPDALQHYLAHENKGGYNALELALDQGHAETALALIAAGIEINIADALGETPLYNAANKGMIVVVNALIDKMRATNPLELQQYLDHQTSFQLTALDVAMNNGHREVAAAIIAAGANH